MAELPLRGKTIVITRPRAQAQELSRLIEALGGRTRIVPTVEVKPSEDAGETVKLIQRILRGGVDYVLLMSRSGVERLFEVAAGIKAEEALRGALNGVVVGAVGPRTRQELERRGVRVQILPLEFSSEGILKSLEGADLQGKVVAIPRSGEGSPLLREGLARRGAEVVEVAIYRITIPPSKVEVSGLVGEVEEGGVDAVTFTSSTSAANLFSLAEELGLVEELRRALNGRVAVVAIGPMTRKTLEGLGVKVDVMPKEYTLGGMVGAMVEELRAKPSL